MTLLLTEEELRDRTPISENTQVSCPMVQMILLAQEKHIRAVLCKDFYKEIVSQVATDTLTPENETLLNDWVKPCLAWYTFYELVFPATNKVREVGVVKQTGSNFTQPNDDIVTRHEDKARLNAEMYRRDLL